ncbi:sugar diacid utilization regulator [Virgibacillus halotolerans]|uniref:XylR N-terminal domain-containing protein n=1 Tax=Virgibacillus halotolerans TaxID=1071053 RepID=UPI001961AC6C|nr:XylR N-terminal domain-containing protein [Virgibacillus halotolerans]MBM7599220.1 sugar diacid utilization regulator [Virgibacillus halotolerans]
MKASELSLNDLLEVSQQSKMLLKSHHMSISSLDAWGDSRKDLINALGIERAKRFLIRSGWNNGKREARMLKDSIRWKDKYEWLIAGSKMHYLNGRTLSYPETFHADMENGEFDVDGYWIDSYEAEQHLHHFSHYHEPICFYLVGYAGGYTSECMGKTIIFKETQCKGKGDNHCSYEGKTLESWGNDISDDLIYYKDIDMADERDQMYQYVEQQREKLKVANILSRQLTDAMLEGKGLKTFADILWQSVHCPIVIENRQFEAFARCGEIPGIAHEVTAKHAVNQVDEMVGSNRRLITELKEKTFRLLSVPIIAGQNILGFITIVDKNGNDDFSFDLLERVATIAAIYLKNKRIAIETEERLRGDLAKQLLNEGDIDEYEVNNRLSLLGYDLKNTYYIFHIEIDNRDHKDYLKIREKFTAVFKRDMEVYGSRSLLFTSGANYIQVIVAKSLIEDKQITVKKYGEQILKHIGKQHIYVGISEETQNVYHFSRQAKEAKKAVELAKMKGKTSTVILSSELGHLTLLLNARDPNELKAFAERELASLIEYDERKNSALLQTLFSYSQNEFNLHKTARLMHVSISGMRYRIQKIEELLDLTLTNSNSRFEIQLSLQVLFLFGGITSK